MFLGVFAFWSGYPEIRQVQVAWTSAQVRQAVTAGYYTELKKEHYISIASHVEVTQAFKNVVTLTY